MESKKIYAVIAGMLLMFGNYAAANPCHFQVVLEETGSPVSGLEFDQAAVATEIEPGSGDYHIDPVEGGYPVYEQEHGFYMVDVTHPDAFANGAWISLFENDPNICVGALEINAGSCAFQTVQASSGTCKNTNNKVNTASGAKGDSVKGSSTFTAGVKDQQKAVAVNKFLTGDLKISSAAAATLCTGTCPPGEGCFPDALRDVPNDGCDLSVVNAGGGKSTYKISWVGNGVRSCEIEALSCGCYKTK